MKINKLIAFLLLISAVGLFFVAKKFEKTEKKRYKVLHVASYHKTFSWVEDIENGIKYAFKHKRIPITYKVFYMDTKRKSSLEEIKSSAKEARELIKEWNPDVVIVSDDNATKYVAAKMKNTNYKFSFCGVNNEPQAYGLPTKNITGVLERHRFVDTIKIIRILAPNIKKITVLSEQSPSSDLIVDQFKEKIPKLPVTVTGVYQSNSYKEWKTIIKEHQNKTDALVIILYFTLKDEQGNPVDSEEVVKWLTSNSHVPETSVFQFFVEDGGLFADAVNGFSQGQLAADKAIKLLNGKSGLDIKVQATTDGIIYINAKRAKSLGLIIPSDLIEGANIIW